MTIGGTLSEYRSYRGVIGEPLSDYRTRAQDADDPGSHFLERLARPAGSYGVDAATYLAIVTREMAGVGLD